jgi:hypothetical protein
MSSPKRPLSSPTSQSKRQRVYANADDEMQEEPSNRAPRKGTSVSENYVKEPRKHGNRNANQSEYRVPRLHQASPQSLNIF